MLVTSFWVVRAKSLRVRALAKLVFFLWMNYHCIPNANLHFFLSPPFLCVLIFCKVSHPAIKSLNYPFMWKWQITKGNLIDGIPQQHMEDTSDLKSQKLMMLEREKGRWRESLNWKNWTWKLNLSERTKPENIVLVARNTQQETMSCLNSLCGYRILKHSEVTVVKDVMLNLMDHWLHLLELFWYLITTTASLQHP